MSTAPSSSLDAHVSDRRFAPVDLEDVLPLVERPQRYAGGERQAYQKPLTARAVKWALCFPETYEIGMSHLGLKVLYHILNEQPEIVADRAYAPWVDMEAELRRRGLPLFAHESRAPLAAFDVLGFSLQYELTYGNVLTMLDLAGVPLHARARGDGQPLVIGGGPNMANPEPLADFFDAFVIGDGEEVVLEISERVRRLRGRRRALLTELAQVPGVYVPQFYGVEYAGAAIRGFRVLEPGAPERVQRIWVEDLARAPYPVDPVVPLAEIVQDRYAIEVLRGCTQGCRFCQAGYWYRPVRERPVEQVVELARAGVARGGFDEVSLCSLSTADHSQVEELARGVAGAVGSEQVSIALPSLRADSFSVGLAEAAGEVKRNGFTFAPETGSERLRRVINKNITDAALLEAVETAYRRGWNLVKLYFMIGIPTETADDVRSIATLVRRVSEAGRRIGGGKRVTAAVGAHVPKAFTPFQWEPFDGVERLQGKLGELKRLLPRSRFVRLKWHDLEPSRLEAALSLGDRRMGAVIEAAWRRGARFDGWGERFDPDVWEAAFAETGVDPAWYTSGRDLDAVLPWDLLDAALGKKFLARERRRARAEQPTSDCRWGDCHRCGIPDAPADIKLAVDRPAAPGTASGTAVAPTTGTAPAPAAGPRSPAAVTMRVRYRVDGPCRFLPHHDLMRAVQRACRVARVPVCFTQGFSPRPRLAFGPPLPMALGGEREVFDAELERPVEGLEARLNGALPAGIECLEAHLVAARGPSITALVRAADYEVLLPADLMNDALRVRLERFAAAPSFVVAKRRPGKPERQIDLKRGIMELDLRGPRIAFFRLAVAEPGGNETRARTVLEAVLGLDREQAARARVTRLCLRDANGAAL